MYFGARERNEITETTLHSLEKIDSNFFGTFRTKFLKFQEFFDERRERSCAMLYKSWTGEFYIYVSCEMPCQWDSPPQHAGVIA